MAKIFRHRTDVAFFDYKDFKTLQRYVNQYGQIESRKKTGLSESQQRRLAVAIKRARHIGLLPFVQNGWSHGPIYNGTQKRHYIPIQ